MQQSLWIQLAQMFGIGKVSFAPGTVASLFTTIVAYPYVKLSLIYKILIILILSVVGTISASHAEKILEAKDPSSVVIDEVVGQLVIFCFISKPSFLNLLFGFLLFRCFDILKPPPIKNIERIFPSGFGIMADDLMAGFLGGTILWLVVKLFM